MIIELLERDRNTYVQHPVKSNRASTIGHPCMRFLVFERTRWPEKIPPSPSLRRRFGLGNLMERYVIDQMRAAGIVVVEQQREYSIDEYQITGHIDGKAIIGDEIIPFDVKSTTTSTLAQIESVDDLLKADSYLVMYPTQLNLYIHMDRQQGGCPERGLFVFIDRVTGQYREIEMRYDPDMAIQTLAKSRTINTHVTQGTLPDPITYNPNWCDPCGYRHLCAQEIVQNARIPLIDDDELFELIDRWGQLRPEAMEFERLNTILTRRLAGRTGIIGSWLIDGAWIARKTAKVPEEVERQYMIEQRIWQGNIRRI